MIAPLLNQLRGFRRSKASAVRLSSTELAGLLDYVESLETRAAPPPELLPWEKEAALEALQFSKPRLHDWFPQHEAALVKLRQLLGR